MKFRYLLHSINHTILLVDTTPIGPPSEIYPPEGKMQTLSSLRFQGWKSAKEFLIKAGADQDQLAKTRNSRATSLAILTILT